MMKTFVWVVKPRKSMLLLHYVVFKVTWHLSEAGKVENLNVWYMQENLMKIVWWELHEIFSFSKKVVSHFWQKRFSLFGIVFFFFFFFFFGQWLVHAKSIIGRLPSFMFLRSFDSMANVANQKLAVNIVDPYQFPGHILENRSQP